MMWNPFSHVVIAVTANPNAEWRFGVKSLDQVLERYREALAEGFDEALRLVVWDTMRDEWNVIGIPIAGKK